MAEGFFDFSGRGQPPLPQYCWISPCQGREQRLIKIVFSSLLGEVSGNYRREGLKQKNKKNLTSNYIYFKFFC